MSDRATEFYTRLGWRQDVTPPGSGVVQFTPPGAAASIHFGADLTTAAPGSAKGYLIVSDIEAARDQLVAAGIEVTLFHLGTDGPGDGLDPDRRSYFSLALFGDPDAMPGCCKRSRPGFLGASTPPSPRSALHATSRRRSGARRPPTARTKSAPAKKTRTGPIGTPSTWPPNSPGRSCPPEEL